MSSKHKVNGSSSSMVMAAPTSIENLTHWLVSRQESDIHDASELELLDGDAPGPQRAPAPNLAPAQGAVIPPLRASTTDTPTPGTFPDELLWAGFNGRCNKNTDTCYSFWAGGSLAVGHHGLMCVHLELDES